MSRWWQRGPDWLPVVVLSESELKAPVLCMPDEWILELKITSQSTRAMGCCDDTTTHDQLSVTNTAACHPWKKFMGRFNPDSGRPLLFSTTKLHVHAHVGNAERLCIVDAQSALSSDRNLIPITADSVKATCMASGDVVVN